MKIKLILFLWATSLFSHADGVIKSQGIISELLAVGYNQALDEARQYYEKNQLTYDKSLVNTTLSFISIQLNSSFDINHYRVFLNDGKLTYFNLFLNKKRLSVNDIKFETEFDTQKNHAICHYQFKWEGNTPLLLRAVLKSICTPQITVKPIVEFTGIGEDSYYLFNHNNGLTYTSNTLEGIPQYIYDSDSQHCVAPLLLKLELFYPGFSVVKAYPEFYFNFDKYPIKKYWVNDRAIALRSGALFSVSCCLEIRSSGGTEPTSHTECEQFSDMSQSRLTINLPLAPSDEDIITKEIDINPFTDEPIKGRFLSALSKNNVEVELLTGLMNAAWREASALRGFSGIPYRTEYQVKSSVLAQYLATSNRPLTQRDLYDPLPNNRIELYRWSDIFNAFVSEHGAKSETITVGVGEHPNIDPPELEEVSLVESLASQLDSVAFLKTISLSSRAQSCPPIDVPFLGQSVSSTAYCEIVEANRGVIRVLFLILWTLSGLVILFRSA